MTFDAGKTLRYGIHHLSYWRFDSKTVASFAAIKSSLFSFCVPSRLAFLGDHRGQSDVFGVVEGHHLTL